MWPLCTPPSKGPADGRQGAHLSAGVEQVGAHAADLPLERKQRGGPRHNHVRCVCICVWGGGGVHRGTMHWFHARRAAVAGVAVREDRGWVKEAGGGGGSALTACTRRGEENVFRERSG